MSRFSFRIFAAAILSLLLPATLLIWKADSAVAQTPAPSAELSLAAWQTVSKVLQHPRCLNCHQPTSPRQGDKAAIHVPLVVRGAKDSGVSAMQCSNCHNASGNNNTSGTPGAPHWQLAPASMNWQGLSSGDLCRMVKNPKLNGNRNAKALVEHMERDALVLWGWNPGVGRMPVSVPHKEFMEQLNIWLNSGAVCPK